jgi:hypothetical protein
MAAPHATSLAVPAVIVIVAGRGGSPQLGGEVSGHERAVSSLFVTSTTGKAPWRPAADGALPGRERRRAPYGSVGTRVLASQEPWLDGGVVYAHGGCGMLGTEIEATHQPVSAWPQVRVLGRSRNQGLVVPHAV